MSDSVQVRNIGGDCLIDGYRYGVTSLQASIGINNWPSYNIEVALDTGSGGAENITSETARKQLGQWQARLLSDSGLNVNLDVSVNGKRVVSMEGKATGASMTLSVGHMRASVSAVPEYAKVDALDLSIYRGAVPDLDGVRAMYSRVNTDAEVNKVIDKVVKYLMSDENVATILSTFDDSPAGVEDKKAFQHQHSVNKNVVNQFYNLLSNSSELGDAWSIEQLKSANGVSYKGQFGEQLFNTLTRSNGSFLSTICSLANMFRAVYVPEMNDIGAIKPKTIMIAKSSGTESWTTVSMSGNAYNTSQLPVGAVVLVLPGQSPDLEIRPQKGQVVVYTNPAKPKYCRTHRMTPPPWLPSDLRLPVGVAKKGTAPKRKGVSPFDLANAARDIVKECKERKRPWGDLLRKWCREELIDQLFGNYITAIVSTTHEFSCGRRVRHSMGSGFLSQTSMQVNISNNGGSIRTVYTCTHSVYDDSVLSKLQ